MRELRRLAWAAAFAAFAATPAVAQTTSSTVTSTGQVQQTTTQGGGNAGGGTSSSGNSLGGTGQGGGTELMTFPKSPNIAPVSAYTTTNSTNTGAQTSNFLRNTFANPYYQGRYNVTVAQVPGGFGAALYPQTGTTTQGGRGGQGGVGAAGASGSINVQDPGGIIGTLPRQISYTSVVKFSSPAVVPAQLQSELSGMISRTTMIANPAGVQVVMTDGTSVILRGTVRDSEEARTVEGMVRMTPGVRQIKNELSFPKP